MPINIEGIADPRLPPDQAQAVCTERTIRVALAERQEGIRALCAVNIDVLPERVQSLLLRDPRPQIRHIIIESTQSPAIMATLAARDESRIIRAEAALFAIGSDPMVPPSPQIVPILLKSPYSEIRSQLVQFPTLHTDLAQDPNGSIRRHVASVTLDRDLLEHIAATDESLEIRAFAARRLPQVSHRVQIDWLD